MIPEKLSVVVRWTIGLTEFVWSADVLFWDMLKRERANGVWHDGAFRLPSHVLAALEAS